MNQKIETKLIITYTEEETFFFAQTLAPKVKSGDIFLIDGDLGVGKSVFVRGLARGLGIDVPMPSPTFTIVNEYWGQHQIYHFDLYRINDPVELFEIGFEDYIYSNAVSFIEWPLKAGEYLPHEAIRVSLRIKNDYREISVIWK